MPGQFRFGWVRQAFDARDRRYAVRPRLVAMLPQSMSLEPNMGPQLDQGNIGACGPHTAVEIVDYEEIDSNFVDTRPSRLFIYYNTRVLMGTVNQDSGVDNRNMLKAMNKTGWCDESIWPYADDSTTYRQKPTAQCYATGLANRITDYAAVAVDLGQMKGAIYSGHPIVFGYLVYQQMMSDEAKETGILKTPTAGASPVGGHDVTLMGYSDTDQPGTEAGKKWPGGHFKFRNHWMNSITDKWGDGGYGYIPYQYATNVRQAFDFWVINTIPGQVPPAPPPDPTPVRVTIDIPFAGKWTYTP